MAGSDFAIIHGAAELLDLLGITDGDGPEVYAELLIKDLTPYVTTQVSSHNAKKKIAEFSPDAKGFLKKYDELRSRNIRDLNPLVYLLSCVVQDKSLLKFFERNAKDRSSYLGSKTGPKLSTLAPADGTDPESSKAVSKTIMTPQELHEFKNKLALVASAANQSSTNDLIKALRGKQTKKGLTGVPNLPSWTNERPYLTGDFVSVHRANPLASVAIGSQPIQMQEITIMEDLLFLMMGVEGKYIMLKTKQEKGKQPTFTVDRTLDTSFQEVVSRLLPVCAYYSTVCRFIEDMASFSHGVVSQALCSAIRHMLKEYLIFTAQLEHQFRKGAMTLPKMWFYIQPCMKTMEILSSIAISVEKGNLKGGAILTLLHEKTQAYIGDKKTRELFLFLTQSACAPYFEMLELWIYQGIVKDVCEEFLVQEQGTFQKETVAEDFTNDYWEKHYTIIRERIPVFLEKVAEKILRTGKYLNVIRQCGHDVKCPHAVEIVYTLNEREYVDHIEKSYEYASRQLLDLFMTHEKLGERLRSIKHYFLLDQGDFFVCFMDLAEDEMRKNAEDIAPSRIEALLELALRTSTANQDPYKDDLTCELLPYDLISQLFSILAISGHDITRNDPTEVDISGLEAFTLSYQVKWPLSLILSKKALTKYQILFRHLFHSRHVERQLCDLWVSCKGMKSRRTDSTTLHPKAFTLLHRMIHYVQNFENYMAFEVIEPNWQWIEDHLRSVENVDDVLKYHNDFLNRCLKDCLLTSPDLLNSISKLMMVCVTFANCFQRYTLSAGFNTEANEPGLMQSMTGKGITDTTTGTKMSSQNLEQMMNTQDFENTVINFEKNFTKELIIFLEKLNSHNMVNMVSRLDHNGLYTERLQEVYRFDLTTGTTLLDVKAPHEK